MMVSHKIVSSEGVETISSKSYGEDSAYVESMGELTVILIDFKQHLILAGYSEELVDAELKRLLSNTDE